MRGIHPTHLAQAFVLASALSSAAWAQDNGNPESVDTIPVEEQAPREPAASSPPDGVLELDAVTVSGDRLGRAADAVKESIAVITAEDLARGTSQNFHELVGSLGNVTRAQNDRQLSIRGVLQNGNGGGDAETITVYLDGIPLPQRAANFGGPLNAFDVEQIEVLRGAQSTTQGRNALAGAVFIKTREAQPFWDATARVAGGTRDTTQTALAVGGPILDDDFSFRLALDESNTDGEVNNLTTGARDAQRALTRLGRLKLAYAPLGGHYEARLQGITSNNSFGDNIYDASNGPRTETANQRYDERYKTDIVGLTQGFALTPSLRVTSVTGYANGVNARDADFDRTEAVGGVSTFDLDDESLTQELRLNFDGDTGFGPVKAVFGVFGERLEQFSRVTGTDVLIGGGSASLDGFVVYNREVETAAAFGELDWEFFPGLSLTGGLRRQVESRLRRNVSDVQYSNPQTGAPIPDEAIEAINDVGESPLVPPQVVEQLEATGFFPLPEDYDEAGNRTFKVWLPKAGLSWEYLPNHVAGLIYSKGYRSGGTSISFFGGEVSDYDPEFTETIELVLRSTFSALNLRLGLNVFATRWDDQQVEIGNSLDYYTIIRNAGESELTGAEASVEWLPLPSLRLSASLGVLDTEYIEFQNLGEDFAGNAFNYAPDVSGGLTAMWRALPGLDTTLNVTHTGSYFGRPDNAPEQQVPSRTLINARVAYNLARFGLPRFTLSAVGRNLTNDVNEQDRFELRGRQGRRYGEPKRIIGQLNWTY